MTATTTKRDTYSRILNEGYGPESWHGPNMKVALTDVTEEQAVRRPSDGRHSIAEIALHHAYTIHSVRERLTGKSAEPFILTGEDWFTVDETNEVTWEQIRATVEREHAELAKVGRGLDDGSVQSPIPEGDRLALVLGATCHAVYHAGQVQLIKRLLGA